MSISSQSSKSSSQKAPREGVESQNNEKNVHFEENNSNKNNNSDNQSKNTTGSLFLGRNDNSSNNHNHHGMKNLHDIDSDDEENKNIVSKLVSNLANGGLAPGLVFHDLPKTSDIEKDIPAIDFTETAKQIIGAATNNKNNDDNASKITDTTSTYSDTDTNYSASTIPTEGTSKDNFFVPAMVHFDDNNGLDSDSDNESFDPMVEESGYVVAPRQVRGGVLGSLLKLYQNEDSKSMTSLSGASDTTQVPLLNEIEMKNLEEDKNKSYKKKKRSRLRKKFKKKQESEARITVHIAELLQRQRFILRTCKALMLYGAPTHRLEEYMIMTSRVLEIDGQFLYIPGCMIISFGDATTRTSEVQLVRCTQGLNLWKLHQVYTIYKNVIHDLMSAEEGNIQIDKVLSDPNLYPPWMCIFLFGFCSAMVTPYAFGGHWVNMAVSFFMGSCVGALQFVFSQRSSVYSNVFEITASIVVSFCGRAFGSIPNSNICFGSVTQGSLALILPGYIILCGSLELQSRNLVAGSVRMFYAIIYSLFLGFGITLGATLFGWMYGGATNEASCGDPISPWFRFLFVPAFTIGISLLNQANWTQIPVMVFISGAGYVVTYFAGRHFKNSTEFTASLAAFIIGVLGNLYSRIWKGLAVSAMLPAIFVQVPSGIASRSSLLSGLQNANEIVNPNSTAITSVASDLTSSMSFGITMIEVCIGISVGLFASTLFVYPFGKTTGLFSL